MAKPDPIQKDTVELRAQFRALLTRAAELRRANDLLLRRTRALVRRAEIVLARARRVRRHSSTNSEKSK